MIFKGITADQINSVHELFLFLHKLKVVGTVHTDTKSFGLAAGIDHLYVLTLLCYDPTTKGTISPEEKVAAYFRASQALGQSD